MRGSWSARAGGGGWEWVPPRGQAPRGRTRGGAARTCGERQRHARTVGTAEKRRAGSGRVKKGCAEGGEGCHQAMPHLRGDGRFSPRPSGGEEVSALTSGPGKTTAVSGRSPGSAKLEAASGPRGVLGRGLGRARLPRRRTAATPGFRRGSS